MNANLYELHNVRRSYGDRLALEVDRLTLPGGCIIGVSGHNGSGKSTLMRLLAFLEDVDAGTLRFRGHPANCATARIRRRVTLLTQEPYLLLRSVGANVGYGLRVRGGLTAAEQRRRVHEALDMVGLPAETFAARSWRELSGGEAQRVALAARLALRPEVLLMDEPTSNLDPDNAARIQEAALLARREWGTSLVVVSHDQSWLRAVSDGVVEVARGRIVEAPAFCRQAEH